MALYKNMTENVKNKIIGNITFPFTNWLYNRKHINYTYYKLLKSEKYSQEFLREIQFNKLIKVIRYAAKYVPYYQKRFRDIGFEISDIRQIEDVKIIPSLTRQDVIDNHHEMVDYRMKKYLTSANESSRGPAEPIMLARFRRNRLVRNTSSGSTGYPTTFYEDGSVTALNWAHELRLKKWYGINPGDREARLVRLSTEYMPSDKKLLFRKALWNQLLLPGVNLTDKEYDFISTSISDFRPRVIWGFTSAITGLSEYIGSTGKKIFSPDLIITWAAPLYQHEKSLIEEVFKCPVTNIYGTRELGHIGGFCNEGNLHINQENYLVESCAVDPESHDPDYNELLVTLLADSPMPFIRYHTGDIGKTNSTNCKCGKKLIVIEDFLGRTGEIFITKNGRMISPNFWCRTFMEKKRANSIKRFQIVYKKNGKIQINIVINENYNQEIESDLKKYLLNNFSEELYYFEYPEDIKPQISGKYQMVVKE
jgi:phenylacetate-CoA ligase